MDTFTAIFGFPILLVGLAFTGWIGIYAYLTTPTEDELIKLLEEERRSLTPAEKIEKPRSKRSRRY